MLIRLALWLFLLCLPLLIVAKALLIFTFFVIASFAMKGAIFLMLAAFSLFIFAGIFFVIKSLWQALRQYFSTQEREQRQILFMKNQTQNRQRLFHFQCLQLDYFKERQRKKILEQNNRQHIHTLSRAIDQDLKSIHTQLSKDYFSQLQHENHRYRSQQNEKALLELHHKIVTMMGK